MEKQLSKKNIIISGIITNNPVLVIVLGMCPTIAQTTTFYNALGLGVATLIVLTFSNIIISLLRKLIPDDVRIPCYIVIVATFVTTLKLFMQSKMPELDAAIGQSVALIIVNCIVLGRLESFASKNGPLDSCIDGLATGIGFTLVACAVGAIRQGLVGVGIEVFGQAAGGFLTLAVLMGIFNFVSTIIRNSQENKRAVKLSGTEVA